MQTILGASGIIGTELAKALSTYTNQIRIVSRTPKKVNATDELFAANLLNAQETANAVKGSSIVYLTIGLTYNTKIWQQQWPIVMHNVIDACKLHNAKLVFFDNIYMYGQVVGKMTEQTSFNPQSKKGAVRAQIATTLLNEIKNKNITALIARAPEFYGPAHTQSGVNAMVFDNIKKGKKLQWMMDDKVQRTYIFTPDAAKATALLGNTESAYNQTWHLPCTAEFINGKQFIQLTENAVGKSLSYTVLKKWMLQLVGLFNPLVKEVIELLYQYEQDYIFDCSKFKNAFPNFITTTYQQGIQQIIKEIKVTK
jgi:nucleoside-diphosphate-sugar epimerase